MLTAGALPHRVSIQLLSEQSDGKDGYVDDLTTVHRRIPARVRPLLGRDLERAHQVDPRITHEVTLRYWRNYANDLMGGRSTIVYHDSTDRVFDIIGPPIDVEEQHIELRQTCKEAA